MKPIKMKKTARRNIRNSIVVTKDAKLGSLLADWTSRSLAIRGRHEYVMRRDKDGSPSGVARDVSRNENLNILLFTGSEICLKDEMVKFLYRKVGISVLISTEKCILSTTSTSKLLG